MHSQLTPEPGKQAFTPERLRHRSDGWNLVNAQAYSLDIRYREATMLSVILAVDNVEDVNGDHTLSDNIGDFRDIKCLFRYGGRRPRRLED